MESIFEEAKRDWWAEVESVAADLVKNGTPPYEAARLALLRVRDRRGHPKAFEERERLRNIFKS